MTLSELISECLLFCQDEQSGLGDKEEKTVREVISLLEEFEIDTVEELRIALIYDRSIYD